MKRGLAVVVIAVVAIALLIAGGGGDRAAAPPGAEAAAPARADAPAARARRNPGTQWRRLEDVPEYGANPDEFVRQRHDYPPDTPERLGPKVGRVLFDLEVVVDGVAGGHVEGGKIHEVRGTPLTADEQAAGQAVLQKFFDEATPIVDGALDQQIDLELVYAQLLALRAAMNCDLSAALELNREEIFTLWPQIEGMHDEECFLTRPDEREVIPAGKDRR